MLVGKYRPQTQYSNTKASAIENAKRLEALKKFKKGDEVIVGGGIRAIFVCAGLQNSAIVRVGAREQSVNPLSLAHA